MNPSTKPITRREFLVVAGCGCAGLVIAGSGCARLGQATVATGIAADACPYGYRFDAYPGQCYRFVDSNGSGYCDFSEPLVTTTTVTTTTVTTTAATGATSATGSTPAATATEETRVILCDRGCSYPGRCGRFTDSDGSGVCDLTEGIVISASSAATSGVTTGGAAATATPAATATASSAATTGATTTAPAVTATPAATATAAATAVTLVVLCDRGCRYPGNCGRYTDNNGTGICDLYEGVPADQAAAYGGSRGGRGGRGG